MAVATLSKGANFVSPHTNSAPKPLVTERQALERVALEVAPYSSGQLAIITEKSKDTTKSWKAGQRCPHAASLLNLARCIPGLQEWLMEESGYGARDAQAVSLDACLRMLHRIASGQDGEAVKASQLLALAYRLEIHQPQATVHSLETRA